jgi:WhiB family transcriptional regulator, redox-sensing transcriptional regulator
MTGRTKDAPWPVIVGGLPPFYADPRRACKGMNVDLFADPHGRDDEDAAKAVCDRCPLRGDCRQFALDNTWTWGIWGATTMAERDILRGTVGAGSTWADLCEEVRLRRAEAMELHLKSVPVTVIAARLGASEDTVYADLARVRKAATRAKYPTAEDRIAARLRGEAVWLAPAELAEVIDRSDDGIRSPREIAAELGIGYRSVYRRRAARQVAA